ncbi:GNAT family N-acetyltransferase [Phaeovulum vinaykumarii]|uniref:Acetyltransferase (GNAT) family protein n=1 Tax=Phaeovulum vinaykumarii TaxID=407234 RepID=A0A1N7L1B3_9RHOB|nr:GNAT family N-acetyltransferase [Phaeovulum vinaykumarii]SIS67581.1 Acetyltransferase (GNAT) family protein [Phaeovulum vinaykumarii]SOC00667.1 acetyltransferase (GNAT) family protein [Phaeovulum vinaykumarii]
MTPPRLSPFGAAHVSAARALWAGMAGVCLDAADSPEALAAFLSRNPGLSFVAEADAGLVGTVLAGHDGRRGALYHLAVAPAARRMGTGRALALAAMAALGRAGIAKVHIHVLADNAAGLAFWADLGWRGRPEMVLMSAPTPAPERLA